MMGVPRKTVLSQRDVVGVPRSVIPILRSSGVTSISIGSNGRCMAPNVPPVFKWKDSARTDLPPVPADFNKANAAVNRPGGDDILVLWQH